MTNVLVSGRVLDAQVGGNTRYARKVYSGLGAHGVEHRVARPPIAAGKARSVAYALFEGWVWPTAPGKDVDVIHYPADTGAQIRGRAPIVSTVHGLATLHVDDVRSGLSDRLWRQRVERLVQVSAQVITVSHSSADDIVRLVPDSAKKIVPILHGIDHMKFNAVAGAEDAATRASVGADEPYFLYLGNLDPRKNVVELCRAAERVYRETGIPLLISGAPAWESAHILDVVKTTPGVRYLGRVPDEVLVPLIRGAFGFCFPSAYEGFGFPVIEAMACGAPVVCSDRGSLKEVAGESALIVADLSADSIAREMLRLVSDDSLRSQLRSAGLVNAQRFQWDDSIAQHARVFSEAAA
ncbi:MAG: glycosyl transferase group 1 [Microbacterium sp.]|jgi:alpha-1,3-rhamnosyl/mannosyltransferase|nr:glycosyl transferase group 1 [Microbacterium sp.]